MTSAPEFDFSDLCDPADEPTSWTLVDLNRVLDGLDAEEQPTILARLDGACLLYPARIHWFQGEPESLKSWCAQAAAVQVIRRGGHVLYVDFEDSARGLLRRLTAMGLTAEQMQQQLGYMRPEERLSDRHGKPLKTQADLDSVLAERTFDLAVIDGVTEAMTTEGLSLYDNPDIARWMLLLPRAIARTGASVICIDHVVKSKENQGRWAIGGQHKMAGTDGAVYGFEVRQPLAKATTEPVTGIVNIWIRKDRLGGVRANARGDLIAVMSINAQLDGSVSFELKVPDADTDAGGSSDPIIRDRILDYLGTYDGASGRQIEKGIGGRAETVRAVLKALIDEGLVRVEKSGNTHKHFLTDPDQLELDLDL